MSHFLHNEACPKCRKEGHDKSADNLARYSDNHAWCWRCGYWEPGDIVKQHTYKKEVVNSKGLLYPEIVPFSQECLDYLTSYGFTKQEIYDNLNGHEDGYSFFDSQFFLVRRLHKKPKVIVKGNVVGNEPIFAHANPSNTIVVVEDILSAIKVSRVIDTIALLKTACHDTLLHRLANRYNNCYLWLDPDMKEHMTNKLLPRIKPYFNKCKIIMSEHDPKVHSTNEIRRYVYENNERADAVHAHNPNP